MNNLELLNWRYSTKLFDTQKNISDADLQDLVDSLRFSPSSYGLQPWHFLVIKDKNIREQLVPHSWNQPQIKDCSRLFVLCARKNVDQNYIEKYASSIAEARNVDVASLDPYKSMMLQGISAKSEDERMEWAKKQVYLALGFLMSACMQKQIDCCPMEGFIPQEYDKLLGLTDTDFTSTVLLPVGYRSADDKTALQAKVRWDEEGIVDFI